jgi:hypothetical protein
VAVGWGGAVHNYISWEPGASSTKLTYLLDVRFGNFLTCNAHNFVIYNKLVFTFEGQARNTMVDVKQK